MKASFKNTVDVLVKAYLANTLQAYSCAACACGNIIAAANHLTIVPASLASGLGTSRFMWAEFADLIEQTPSGRDPHSIWDGATILPAATSLIANTGYTPDQLGLIEDAFMNWCSDGRRGSDFDSLLRVVDVLADIHGVDLAAAEAAKALFVLA